MVDQGINGSALLTGIGGDGCLLAPAEGDETSVTEALFILRRVPRAEVGD